MNTFTTIQSLRQQIQQWRQQKQRIAFVPTMGNLHVGHLALVQRAQQVADKVVVSIFVNPLQFNDINDLDNYPRTLDADQQQLQLLHADLLFLPTVEMIYPEGLETTPYVEVPQLSDLYCGASRPGHFRGVTTVVAKLFNIVLPDVAIFGEKDFQQLFLIKKMVHALYFPIEIIGLPTVRNHQGLALSSRNSHLTPSTQDAASIIYQLLCTAQQHLQQQVLSFSEIKQQITLQLEPIAFQLDYFHIINTHSLYPAHPSDHHLTLLIAVYVEGIRLIDNLNVVIKN